MDPLKAVHARNRRRENTATVPDLQCEQAVKADTPYADFMHRKVIRDVPTGIDKPVTVHEKLFPFQKDVVRWALRRGRALIAEDCGLGKTVQQEEYAKHVHEHTGGDVLILAPLTVSQQSVREGEKFGVKITPCRQQHDVKPGINITNYEMLHHFEPSKFVAIVLDESSILKSYNGAFRNQIVQTFKSTPFRLAATATPAPNDYMELGNQAEFLGVMSRTEMLCTFFTHDGGQTSQWRLKKHAQDDFWRWLASWAVMIRKPSDIGHEDTGFDLPPLHIHQEYVGAEGEAPAHTLSDQRRVKRASLQERCRRAADLANASTEPFVVWGELNDECDLLAQLIPDSVQVAGADDIDVKERRLMAFADGQARVLVTKPAIASFGLNWQHCPNMVFANVSHSYERFYQAVRRCYRFGQTQSVQVHQIMTRAELPILENIQRKQAEADNMAVNMVKHMSAMMRANLGASTRERVGYEATRALELPAWMRSAA
jgi:hypothetical protein